MAPMSELTVEALLALPDGEIVGIDRPDGTRLRCVLSEAGGPAERRTVILAHGIFCAIPTFNLVVPELVRRGYRVITFDQRAHGRSTCGSDGTTTKAMAGDYRAVLEHFDVENGILVGHSMGAYLAAMFCVEHPDVMRERLGGLVLLGGHGGDVARGNPVTKIQVQILERGFSHWLLRNRRIGHRLSRMVYGREAPHPAFLETTRRMFLDTDYRPILRILEEMIAEDHYERIAAIDLPTAVIFGEFDRTCPPWCSKRLANIAGATSTCLPGVGHMVMYEAPYVVIDAVAKLASAPATKSRAVGDALTDS
jgi:non-heme chloroperoxidase